MPEITKYILHVLWNNKVVRLGPLSMAWQNVQEIAACHGLAWRDRTELTPEMGCESLRLSSHSIPRSARGSVRLSSLPLASPLLLLFSPLLSCLTAKLSEHHPTRSSLLAQAPLGFSYVYAPVLPYQLDHNGLTVRNLILHFSHVSEACLWWTLSLHSDNPLPLIFTCTHIQTGSIRQSKN